MSMHESDFDCHRRVDAAAYVLGSLPDDELAHYREHLQTCAECRSEVAGLQPVVDELPASVPSAVASEALRVRIMTTVRSEAELLSAAGHEADRPTRLARGQRLRRFSLLGAGATAAAAVAAAVVLLVGGSKSTHRHLSITAGITEGIAKSAKASLRQRDGHAELVVAHMPQPALGKIYEVWLSRGGTDAKPTNALFSVTNKGSGAVDVPNSLHGIKQVMVTSEPLGGSLHPTSKPVIRVLLRS